MIKYFCDICENEADEHDYKLPFTFKEGTYWNGRRIQGFIPTHTSMQPYTSHLCSHCANLIERFIKGMKGEKNE
jgi:hypothetical protein